ncbi:hypothetical protein PENTCL1PPCAC_7963 [Pristionchus entomophagus]|uniref:Apple domain-containing protein n=1 Tax=Pristionchus entomophagus TaxID=358040 RepID=A0AAV5SRK5_9BILA|nr:hypothetical protein PENTCL1PPCAC_7963 [Pristionchus entomophagus]
MPSTSEPSTSFSLSVVAAVHREDILSERAPHRTALHDRSHHQQQQEECAVRKSSTVTARFFGINRGLSLLSSRSLLIMNVILLSSIRTSLASVRCFNTETGNSIAGADYHRVRGVDHRCRTCAIECRDDPSCLAFEYNVKDKLCFLKSRSLSGALAKNDDTMVGFCLDEDDEQRDRFYNHEIDGPIAHEAQDIEGEDCRTLCMNQEKATIYSWTPVDIDDDDSSVGTCKCIESIKSITLNFNTYSGFLPQKRHKFRF